MTFTQLPFIYNEIQLKKKNWPGQEWFIKKKVQTAQMYKNILNLIHAKRQITFQT